MMHVGRGYRMEAPEGCPRAVYEIMQEAWQEEPAARPTFKDVASKLHMLRTESSQL